MKRQFAILVFGLLPAFGCAIAQGDTQQESCIQSQYGDKSMKNFLAFDADLRAALTSQNAAALALLVQYPLRVNERGRGTFSIDNPEALKNHFQQIFTPFMRKAVLDQSVASFFCRYDMGVMYGAGELWVDQEKYGWVIKTVNVHDKSMPEKDNTPSLEIVCRTEKHSILIDSKEDNIFRYRVWDKPHSILQKPNLEISGGKQTWEGTGVCAHSVWTFQNGHVTYTISSADGCFEDSPPAGAQASLTISVEGKQDIDSWCY